MAPASAGVTYIIRIRCHISNVPQFQNLKIFFHDFGAYPFIFPLTELLAQSGHTVTHAYVNNLSIERNAVVSDLTPHHQRLPLKMP